MNLMRTRRLLLVNAVLSAGSGVAMAAAPATVAEWLGIADERWVRWVGIALGVHGLAILGVVRRQDVVRWARLNVLAIAPYPLLVIALVVAGVVDEPGGIALALVDAAVIGALAVALRAASSG